MTEEIFKGRANILDDLPQNNRRNISARMIGNRGATPVSMPVLHMRTTLTNQLKAHRL